MLKVMRFKNLFCRWAKDEDATALTEAVILFPVLISLMMAVYDLGTGIVIAQKTITASQIVADLVTRKPATTRTSVLDYMDAGALALEPYSTASFGVDIAAVSFDENDDLEVYWRETDNMAPDEAAVAGATGLEEEGGGVVVVTVVYTYTPFFTNFVVDEINFRETFYLHGRRSAIINCDDCTS